MAAMTRQGNTGPMATQATRIVVVTATTIKATSAEVAGRPTRSARVSKEMNA